MQSTSEIDSFFVGDGSAELLGKLPAPDFSEQLHQMFTHDAQSSNFNIEEDTQRFAIIFDRPETDYEGTMLVAKRHAYAVFDFLETKAELAEVPVREEDLLVSDDDRYVIDYLKAKSLGTVAYNAICTLTAFRDMGIEHARFVTDCECPLCRAAVRKIYAVDDVSRLLSAGEYLTHAGVFGFQPVIYREHYEGPCKNLEWDDFDHSGVHIVGLPKEISFAWDDFCEKLVADGVRELRFVNMAEDLKEVDDSAGIVVLYKDGVLKVHNSYVGDYGPVDFLKNWFAEDKPEKVDPQVLAECDVFFLKGKKVARYKGSYWRLENGERAQ
jgi:hypothetical protein